MKIETGKQLRDFMYDNKVSLISRKGKIYMKQKDDVEFEVNGNLFFVPSDVLEQLEYKKRQLETKQGCEKICRDLYGLDFEEDYTYDERLNCAVRQIIENYYNN